MTRMASIPVPSTRKHSGMTYTLLPIPFLCSSGSLFSPSLCVSHWRLPTHPSVCLPQAVGLFAFVGWELQVCGRARQTREYRVCFRRHLVSFSLRPHPDGFLMACPGLSQRSLSPLSPPHKDFPCSCVLDSTIPFRSSSWPHLAAALTTIPPPFPSPSPPPPFFLVLFVLLCGFFF